MQELNLDKMATTMFVSLYPNLDIAVPDKYKEADERFLFRYVVHQAEKEYPAEWQQACMKALTIINQIFRLFMEFEEGHPIDATLIQRYIDIKPPEPLLSELKFMLDETKEN